MTHRPELGWPAGLALLLVASFHPLAAQVAPAPEARLQWTTAVIRLDGVPDEPAWATADSISDFTQTDPDEGRPVSERTVVRLLGTSQGLYVALWAWDREPAAIRRAQLRRDADFDSDDQFSLILDPQRDHRSGFVFSVNPNGALRDAELLTFEDANEDWNGVWDARARRHSWGWSVEVFIPWQTLRYRLTDRVWGVNFERVIRRKNEVALWRAWRRTEGLLFLEREGTIGGFGSVPHRAGVEVRPYVAATSALRDSAVAFATPEGKAGLDAKLAVLPALTLDLTVNTDFAQVEADRQVVNLTRFPLFFPEQRPFFLESSGIFTFGHGDRTLAFYSRRIGLQPDGTPNPVAVGARLTGRIASNRVGFLALRTGDPEDASDVVVRVKHDVLGRGYVGGILTAQDAAGVRGARLLGGLDANLPFVVRGQNLVLGAYAARSRDSSGAPGGGASSWRVFVDYPNDAMDNFLGYKRVESGYDPALGFVEEAGIALTQARLEITPRPHRFGIRRLAFQPIDLEHVQGLDGRLSHAEYAVQPFGAELESGDELSLQLQRFTDAPPDTFEIFPGDTVLPGRYWWNRAELEVATSAGRAVSVEFQGSVGDYYSGRATEVTTAVTLRAAPHVITTLELTQQDVRLGATAFVARAARARVDVAATPRLAGTLFVQGDNASDRLTLNVRLHWTPGPGSDAYVVWNSAWPSGLPGGVRWGHPERGALVAKMVYYFRLS